MSISGHKLANNTVKNSGLHVQHINTLCIQHNPTMTDADQPNTKRNHANDPLEVPIGPITRARAKKLKEALNEFVQNIWSKMDLEGLGTKG